MQNEGEIGVRAGVLDSEESVEGLTMAWIVESACLRYSHPHAMMGLPMPADEASTSSEQTLVLTQLTAHVGAERGTDADASRMPHLVRSPRIPRYWVHGGCAGSLV